MGDYLLKGYKMLATVCDTCGTIELEDKQNRIYCIACSEVDCDDNSKDNPVLNAQAASTKVAEGNLMRDVESQLIDKEGRPIPVVEEVVTTRKAKTSNADPSLFMHRPSPMRSLSNTASMPLNLNLSAVAASQDVVMEKLVNATQILAQTDDIEMSNQLVTLIKNCADCIASLRNASAQSQAAPST